MFDRSKVTNKWFYSNPGPFAKFFTIFVKGDMIVLLPFILLVALIGFWSVRVMLLIAALFLTVRSFGEMMYWFFQQFYDLKYRPNDFGFTGLSNKAIYILYQLFTMCLSVLGMATILYLVYMI